MGQGSEELTTQQIEDDIEATRTRLSRDVDELGDKVSPSQVMSRKRQAAKGRITSMKDRVMGSAHDTRGSVGDTASGAVHSIESRTEGNPLAAGVIAFGAGMLVSSLIPASRVEQNLAQQGMEAAKEHGQPVMDQAKGMAQDLGADVKESARAGAEEVKSTAQDSAQSLKDQGRDSAQQVRQS
jgi:ElaB/YqjD/DUF883 family membrane-anchored ribosome-binding protein